MPRLRMDNATVVSIRIPGLAMKILEARALKKDIPHSILARHYLLQKLGLTGKRMRLDSDRTEKIANVTKPELT